MLSIELKNLRFHAYHGLYKEEKVIGAEFELDVTVLHYPNTVPVLHIKDTIDYTIIYEIVKKHMEQPAELLETLATRIAHEIFAEFSHVEEINIYIRKVSPPIISFRGSIGVRYTLTKENYIATNK
ncbi:dihydroneopterin aldolase [Danxiaibacter flavus]|uniref:7,8-dihydroneopterin aldolase n=1 Tax=Danxiaibacter flavus TaxID=3049108 RepID=A0ABV3ZID5_9BACT|nr:dihydroneopterin aldolase [Chitinophagaceae bacterium DXS]